MPLFRRLDSADELLVILMTACLRRVTTYGVLYEGTTED